MRCDGRVDGSEAVELWQVTYAAGVPRLPELLRLLSPAELERAARYRFATDRERFIVSHAALRFVLGNYTGQAPEKVKLLSGPWSKPQVDQSQSPSQLHFNMSHSGNAVMYAVSIGRDVGVDLERIQEGVDVWGIVNGVFSAKEVSSWRALPPAARQAAFFACWVRKEAYLKCLGIGLRGCLSRLSASVLPHRAGRMTLVEDEGSGASLSVTDAPAPPGYAAAVVTGRRRARVICRNDPHGADTYLGGVKWGWGDDAVHDGHTSPLKKADGRL